MFELATMRLKGGSGLVGRRVTVRSLRPRLQHSAAAAAIARRIILMEND